MILEHQLLYQKYLRFIFALVLSITQLCLYVPFVLDFLSIIIESKNGEIDITQNVKKCFMISKGNMNRALKEGVHYSLSEILALAKLLPLPISNPLF